MKKGQFKIQEMAFVLLAVIVLFGFVLIFFSKFQLSSIQRSAQEIRTEKAIDMLHMIAGLPELRCSKGAESNCIDKDKLEGFMKVKSNYYDIWRNSFITRVKIEQFYPVGKEYELFKDASAKSDVTYSTYIPLCEQQQYLLNCSIGKISVSSESVK